MNESVLPKELRSKDRPALRTSRAGLIPWAWPDAQSRLFWGAAKERGINRQVVNRQVEVQVAARRERRSRAFAIEVRRGEGAEDKPGVVVRSDRHAARGYVTSLRSRKTRRCTIAVLYSARLGSVLRQTPVNRRRHTDQRRRRDARHRGTPSRKPNERSSAPRCSDSRGSTPPRKRIPSSDPRADTTAHSNDGGRCGPSHASS